MSDTGTARAPSEEVMDQAIDWIIALKAPTPRQCQGFDAWLAEDPMHAHAYARAAALWDGSVAEEVRQVLARQCRPAKAHARRGRWVVALVLLAIAAPVAALWLGGAVLH